MSKATLIWFRGHDKPFKAVSVTKGAIYAFLGVIGLVTTAAVVLFVVANFQALELAQWRSQGTEIKETLDTRNGELERLKIERETLDRDRQSMSREFERVRALEQKLRKYLGLQDDKKAFRNQGGSGSSNIFKPETPNPALMGLKESGDASLSASPAQAATGLSDALSYLDEKRAEIKSIPTIVPVRGGNYYLSAGYGWRTNPVNGEGREFHYGLDIAGDWRTPIIAPADGTVDASVFDADFGNIVRISHTSGIVTGFAHLDSRLVKAGQKVLRGQPIGYMGKTGRTTGVHLHYLVMRNGRYVDPGSYIWDDLNELLASRK